MQLFIRHVVSTSALTAACLAGCGNATPEADSSKSDASVSTPQTEAGVGGGSDAASLPDQTTSDTSPVAVDSGVEAGVDAGAHEDAGSHAGADSGIDSGIVLPTGCTLPPVVSFQKDVQGFLPASCGNTGCHVVDSSSTVAEGGYDHAYDWITGTAHASSCPETPTPFRFQIVMAVMKEADPPTCSKCGLMPASTTPPHPALTACQMATLQAWLDEPYVVQLHRNDGISPTTPYAMPPFN